MITFVVFGLGIVVVCFAAILYKEADKKTNREGRTSALFRQDMIERNAKERERNKEDGFGNVTNEQLLKKLESMEGDQKKFYQPRIDRIGSSIPYSLDELIELHRHNSR